MRGSVVYPLLSERGDILTWFGRDPAYEEKRRRWVESGRAGTEPEKFRFVRGFHRGLDLFGQQVSRLDRPDVRETLDSIGLFVVEGPNGAIRLDKLGIPAVALLLNIAAKEQVEKIARFAHHVARGRILLTLDCDAEGEAGARQVLYEVAKRCEVRLAWSGATIGGRFRGRQPESLSMDESRELLGGRSLPAGKYVPRALRAGEGGIRCATGP